jgi:isocitrate dehydrogenase
LWWRLHKTLLCPVVVLKLLLRLSEFEASHGTVADLWAAHQDGKETSMNPLGMVEALLGAMLHRYGAHCYG